MQSEPRSARTAVWALPVSLAATPGIDVSFSSSGYLDVSVHRVPFRTLWIGVRMTEGSSAGFPHSDISGSMDICSSPKLFAAYHVFHRLSVPRHPPCALLRLTSVINLPINCFPVRIALQTGGFGLFLWVFSHVNNVYSLLLVFISSSFSFWTYPRMSCDELIKIHRIFLSVCGFQGTFISDWLFHQSFKTKSFDLILNHW